MQKVRIYVKPADISQAISLVDKNVLNKLRNVLRLEKGHQINIFDGAGKEYLYLIEELSKKYCNIRKKSVFREVKPFHKKIILGFPLVREDRLDFILQKGTELGVHKFIPFICERNRKIKPSGSKLERWNKIIIEATRQSERLWLPSLSKILDIKDIAAAEYDYKIVASANGSYSKVSFAGDSYNLLFIVGPEGGFSDSENQVFKDNKFQFLRLSSNILRVETACIFSVGLANYLIESR